MASVMPDFSVKHCVTESTNLLATHWGKHIRNLRVPDTDDTLDNGVIVAKGDFDDETDVFKMSHTGVVFKGVIEGQGSTQRNGSAANGAWVIGVTECEDGKSYLVLQTPITYYDYPREINDESMFFNKKGDVVRCYQLAYDDRFALSKEGFTTEPTDADIGKEVTVDAATGKLVIS